jgi:hypothetical protein
MLVMWESRGWLMVRYIRDRMDYAQWRTRPWRGSLASCTKRVCSSANSGSERGGLAHRPGGIAGPADD